jgi:hypothetical protein
VLPAPPVVRSVAGLSEQVLFSRFRHGLRSRAITERPSFTFGWFRAFDLFVSLERLLFTNGILTFRPQSLLPVAVACRDFDLPPSGDIASQASAQFYPSNLENGRRANATPIGRGYLYRRYLQP